MKGRYYAIIFFVVIGINAIYSLPDKSNSQLAADVDPSEGLIDLDSNVDLFDEAADGRFKRDLAFDYDARKKKVNKDKRIANHRMNARNERTTPSPVRVLQLHLQGTIERLIQEGHTPRIAPMRV